MRDGPSVTPVGAALSGPLPIEEAPTAGRPEWTSVGTLVCHQRTGLSDLAKASRASRAAAAPPAPIKGKNSLGLFAIKSVASCFASVAKMMETAGGHPGSPGLRPTSLASLEMRSTMYCAASR